MTRQIDDIQILRAVAAIAVLLFHVERELSSSRPTASTFGEFFTDLAWLGNAGVDIFFVISGFIMYFVHSNDFEQHNIVKRFMLRRVARIVPTYWLLTTLTVVGLALAPELFNSRSLDWGWITASYFFVPWHSPAGDISPPVGPGWTLNYEMYFYVVFATALAMPRRAALAAITIFMISSVLLGLLLKPSLPILVLMSSSLLIEFLCGIWIAWGFKRGITLGPRQRMTLLFFALALFAAAPIFYTNGDLATWWRLPFFGLPAAMLMAAVVLRTRLDMPKQVPSVLRSVFVKLGDSSYALYITHIFTLRIATILLHLLLPPLPAILEFVLVSVLAVVVGHLFFTLVERPIYRCVKIRLFADKSAGMSA